MIHDPAVDKRCFKMYFIFWYLYKHLSTKPHIYLIACQKLDDIINHKSKTSNFLAVSQAEGSCMLMSHLLLVNWVFRLF